MWRSAEIQRVDLRGRRAHELVNDLERDARRALATGCRRLEIELSGHDELSSGVVVALVAVDGLIRSSGGELTVRWRAARRLGPAALEAPGTRVAPPRTAGVPLKWAA
jgi:hypothetical protein